MILAVELDYLTKCLQQWFPYVKLCENFIKPMMLFKVMGGEPLLTLVSVDWFKVDKAVDNIALHPKCLVQVLP